MEKHIKKILLLGMFILGLSLSGNSVYAEDYGSEYSQDYYETEFTNQLDALPNGGITSIVIQLNEVVVTSYIDHFNVDIYDALNQLTGSLTFDTSQDVFNWYAINFGSGDNGGDEQPEEPESPCDAADQAVGVSVTSQYDNGIDDEVEDFDAFEPPGSNQNEQYFNMYRNSNGDLEIYCNNDGCVRESGSTGGNIVYTSDTEVIVHTHPADGLSAPSATDMYNMYVFRNNSANYSTSYIVAADGTKYAMHIDDVSKMNAFMTNNPGFADAGTNDFDVNTALGAKYREIKDSFLENNNTENQAHEKALAFVLKESGISLLKADPNSKEFKKIDTDQKKNPDGTDAKDANGKNIYNTSNCP
ncbi:hypothetical protein I5M32_11400 [Pedobacter sp. SD-b]|uniref:Uncharacterized protein n=1 Tax=Pedobacter segetis TaxID=2793069 RepID=A0ABS1BKZ9_9SPHI|nr:hypothetical protein [Pedobacter segetis]MBK0383563.1 hypothetical protein [Pedobacter segetis]